MKLPSNEVLYFNGDQVTMTDKTQVMGLVEKMMNGSAYLGRNNPFSKRGHGQRRYEVNEMMQKRKNSNSVLVTPSSQRRLDADALRTLQGTNTGQTEISPDRQSNKSKRSLSINVRNVSKIVKMKDGGPTAISKVKPGAAAQEALRNRSAMRPVSRGNGNGLIPLNEVMSNS